MPAGSGKRDSRRLPFGEGEKGVVDRDLRHLDFENLWVSGGSAFTAYSAMHPTLTIAALAIRLSEHLAGES